MLEDALALLLNYIDPDGPIPDTGISSPQTGSRVTEVENGWMVNTDTEWVTWTGTYYPTLDSVPWQARGSAVEVPARR